MTRQASKLVRNETKSYSRITCNLVPAGCRVDTLEGREHTVVPAVILTEGVHNGSQGLLYYSKEELSKTPVVWNHKPIVVYHPSLNGEGISACDPVVINQRKIGVMMNTRFEGGRLKSEAWIEKDRANAVDERIMAAIENKEMMELSTGLFIDVEATPGKWKKESYKGIARNFRPDHLALLPDQKGACSIADGAGLLRNSKYRLKDGPIANEMSFSDITTELSDELNKKFNPSSVDAYRCWVVDVFSDYVVYSMNGSLYRIDYTASDTGIEFSDEAPVEVVRVTDYKVDTAQNQVTNMNKTQLIAAILAANCGLVEADKATLNDMTEAQLNAVANMVKEHPTINCFGLEKKGDKFTLIVKNKTETPPAGAAAAPTAQSNNPPPAAPASQAAPAINTPAAPKMISTQEYIAAAPPEVRDVLANSMSVYNDEKRKLVDVILANKRNIFTKQDLENRPLGELKALAQLAVPEEAPNTTHLPNYGGQAPVGNAKIEVLALPTMNFDKPEKKTAAA